MAAAKKKPAVEVIDVEELEEVLEEWEAEPAVPMLGREQILDADDIKSEVVEVPEWGGSVMVIAMDGTVRDKFESSLMKGKGKNQVLDMSNIRAKVCALSICDEQGRLVFSTTDVKELGKKSAAALSRVFSVAQELSGISKDDLDDYTEALEDSPSEGSASD